VGAATWLRELKDPATEKSLRAAISREQQDNAKAQMLLALEATGASLDDYIAPERLHAEATAGLAKKNALPAAMGWLRFDALPAVHWNDGTLVDPVIFQWFAASAVKAKSSEPSPLLRRHADSMRTDEARRFAEALFESWVSRDLAPRPRDECERDARQTAGWKIKYAERDPTGETYPQYKGLTVEQGMLLELPRALEQPAGSGTDSKGLLSVVAALGGPELAQRVLAYVKKWRGHRVHQGKAMIQMLAGMEHPAAIQVVLTIAQRFRPKGLQEEAANQAELLAERRGWTIEDLADRTVPRGGFDDDGRLQLDYGDRSFTAHLRDDLSIELVADSTAKVIKSLPAPRQDEDEAEVKALQQDLAAAKKEIKATAKLQPERLFVSMCVERSWDADDFTRYIVGHPVMRRLASRLARIAETGNERKLFRPLSDGTLIDIDDDEIVLSDDAKVFIAHDAHISTDIAARWLDHFADYSVAPLFPQFGRPTPPNANGTAIDAVKGHVINALALRGAITKHGWQLGEAQDGGMVMWVQKDFGGAGLTGVIEMMGTPAYADDSTTALLSMYFARRGGAGNPSRAVPLSDVPPILLQETYGEALAIAAAGTGYDPDHEKKATYG
ncbi:MAG: DUF4132 domain-containing protein, partial [Actinomycetota bacterium]|nr:DUF4132 domain-containing protein [Actinomycetota bacterium]